MPHTMVTFRLHRSGVILLMVFGMVLAVLIYVAGYMTGVRVERKAFGGMPRKMPAVATTPTKKMPPTTQSPPTTPTTQTTSSAQTAPQPSHEQRLSPPEPLTLRLAVHTSEDDAKTEIATLTAQGLQPTIVQAATTSGVTLYTIVVGRYDTRDAANAAAVQLQRRLGFMPVIIPAPPL